MFEHDPGYAVASGTARGPGTRTHALPKPPPPLPRVRLRVTRGVVANGRTYSVGDEFELEGRAAQFIVDSGKAVRV